MSWLKYMFYSRRWGRSVADPEGVQAVHLTPPPPYFWISYENEIICSVRPFYFILMRYLRKWVKISKANTPYLYTYDPPFQQCQQSWIRPCRLFRVLPGPKPIQHEPWHEISNNVFVRPPKPQISLRIRAVWSEPLLILWIFYVLSYWLKLIPSF